MRLSKRLAMVLLVGSASLLASAATAQDTAAAPEGSGANQMSFFVTSQGLGDGANLGGLEGADAHCQALAEAAGSTGNWAAYLSTQGEGAVNARDRIGEGPWHNANGDLIAEDVEGLHADDVNLTRDTVSDETGEMVPSVPADYVPPGLTAEGRLPPDFDRSTLPPTEHDILTGTQLDGTAFAEGDDMTCGNWTLNGEGGAMVGHSDRRGLTPDIQPWNTSHPSAGCSQQSLVQTGGAGRFYCFATGAVAAAQ